MIRRSIFAILAVALIITVNVSCTKGDGSCGDKDVKLETKGQKVSYIMGFQQGMGLKRRNLDKEMDINVMMQGLKDGIKGESKIEEKDMQKIMQDFFKEFTARQQAELKKQGLKHKAEGEKFLKENAQKEGVVVTESGLQYKVIKKGDGPKPKATDEVEVHYTGTLIDGTEFDSSYKRNQPSKFPLNKVIPAWTEGVQLMNVGSKFKFFAPSNLAYGEKGTGSGNIPPNAVLIFDVELLNITTPKVEVSDPKEEKKSEKSK